MKILAAKTKAELEENIRCLDAKIKEAEAFLAPYRDTLHDDKQLLKYLCSDLNCHNVVIKSDYIPSNYYDRAQSTKFASCNVCGFYKTLSVRSLGGF